MSPVVFGIVFSHVDDSSAVRHRGEDWLRKFILGGSPFNAAALVSFGGGGALTRLPNIYAYPISMSLRGPIGDYYH